MGSPLGINAPLPPNVTGQTPPPPPGGALGQLAGVMGAGAAPPPGTQAVAKLQEISKSLMEEVAPLVQQARPSAMVWFRRSQEAINNLLREIMPPGGRPAPVLPGPSSPLGPPTESAAPMPGGASPESAEAG